MGREEIGGEISSKRERDLLLSNMKVRGSTQLKGLD